MRKKYFSNWNRFIENLRWTLKDLFFQARYQVSILPVIISHKNKTWYILFDFVQWIIVTIHDCLVLLYIRAHWAGMYFIFVPPQDLQQFAWSLKIELKILCLEICSLRWPANTLANAEGDKMGSVVSLFEPRTSET